MDGNGHAFRQRPRLVQNNDATRDFSAGPPRFVDWFEMEFDRLANVPPSFVERVALGEAAGLAMFSVPTGEVLRCQRDAEKNLRIGRAAVTPDGREQDLPDF